MASTFHPKTRVHHIPHPTVLFHFFLTILMILLLLLIARSAATGQ